MKTYKKKPVHILAVQINTSADIYALADELEASTVDEHWYYARTPEGRVGEVTFKMMSGGSRKQKPFSITVLPSQWVVRSEHGDIEVMTDKVFKRTFEDA